MAELLEFGVAAELANGLLVMAAKGLVILLVVTAACVSLRDASASLKHLCWGLGLGALLMLPILSLVVPAWNVGVLEGGWAVDRGHDPATMTGAAGHAVSAQSHLAPAGEHASTADALAASEAEHASKSQASVPSDAAQASRAQTPVPAESSADPGAAVASGGDELGAAGSAGMTSSATSVNDVVAVSPTAVVSSEISRWTLAALPIAAWIVGIWAVGAAALILHLILSSILVRRVVRTARPVTDRAWLETLDEIGDRLFIRRKVRLLESPRAGIPVACGAVRPVILIPPGAESWTDERRRCVLAHELAHVKRWDTVTQPAARIACALHWFNPLAWKAARAMQLEREKACDDYVLTAARARASEYAGHLLDIARRAPGSLSPPIGAIAMARRSQLEGRVLAILDDERHRSLARPPIAAAVIAALLVVFPIAAMSPYATPRSEQPERMFFEPVAPGTITVDGEQRRSAPEAQPESEKPAVATTYEETVGRTWRDTIERTFNVAEGGLLTVDADHGNIRLRSGASNEVHVSVRRTPRGRAAAEDYEVSFKQEGDRISIVGTNRTRNSGRDGVNVDFEITVPQRFNIDAETAGGNIAVDDLNGRVQLNTSGGNLSLGRISGQVNAHTSGGNISLDGSEGDVVVNTSGGNISLGRVGGTVKATTSGGNISVDEVNGQITARTSGGQILARIARQPQANSLLRTSGGGITVYLATDVAVDLDAKTSAGHVETDVEVAAVGRIKKDELRGRINGGGPLLELDTSAGFIHIKKL